MYRVTIEGSNGTVYFTGSVEKINETVVLDLMCLHNPTDDSVINVYPEPYTSKMNWVAEVSSSDDFYIDFS